MKKSFWYGKQVLVTGGNGFVASHLIKQLIERGAHVTTTVRNPHLFNATQLVGIESKNKVLPTVEQCDLLDFSILRTLCEQYQIDTIFHLAAASIVSTANNSPLSTLDNNVMSTLNILEVARINHIPRIVVASTYKVYGDHDNDVQEPLPYKEGYTLRGLNVYSASKVCTDILSQTYSSQFKLPVVVVRACNTYGPEDLNFARLIPRTIMCLLSDRPPRILKGHEKALCEYVYVEDVVRAYLLTAEKIPVVYGEKNSNMPQCDKDKYGWIAFNVGSYSKKDLYRIEGCENIKSAAAVIELLRNKIKDIEPVLEEGRGDVIEMSHQYVDATKIYKLGFNSHTNFIEGIDRTIEWYRTHFDRLAPLAERYLTN